MRLLILQKIIWTLFYSWHLFNKFKNLLNIKFLLSTLLKYQNNPLFYCIFFIFSHHPKNNLLQNSLSKWLSMIHAHWRKVRHRFSSHPIIWMLNAHTIILMKEKKSKFYVRHDQSTKLASSVTLKGFHCLSKWVGRGGGWVVDIPLILVNTKQSIIYLFIFAKRASNQLISENKKNTFFCLPLILKERMPKVWILVNLGWLRKIICNLCRIWDVRIREQYRWIWEN